MSGYTCQDCGGYFLDGFHNCLGKRSDEDQWDYTKSAPFPIMETNLILLHNDQQLLVKLLNMLDAYADERSETESVIDFLERILIEHEQLKLQQEWAEGWK